MTTFSGVLLRLLSCAAILCGVTPVQAAADKVLNLYIWSDYVAPDTLANFTKRTGVTVNMDVFDSSEMLEAKLLAGGSGYDVVVPNGPVLRRAVQRTFGGAGFGRRVQFRPRQIGLEISVGHEQPAARLPVKQMMAARKPEILGY